MARRMLTLDMIQQATIPGNLATVERLHVPEIIQESGEAVSLALYLVKLVV